MHPIIQPLAYHFSRCVVIGLHRIPAFYERLGIEWERPDWDKAISRTGIALHRGLDMARFSPPPWWTEIPAMWGCNESHKAVIARALSDGIENILIMEDDCAFATSAPEILHNFMEEVPDDWDALMLGGQVSVVDGKTTRVAQFVSRCVQVERLHCYALSRRGMQIFYDALCEPGNCRPNDYRFGDLQEQGKLITYRCEPFIAYQVDGPSAISGRVEPARAWDERVDVRIREPGHVPMISLVCPFAVLDRLRQEGIVCNGGETPPQFAMLEPGRVERGERQIAEMLRTCEEPVRENFIREMRRDAAFHRHAMLALWHPSAHIPFDGVIAQVEAQEYDEAIEKLAIVKEGQANNSATQRSLQSNTSS